MPPLFSFRVRAWVVRSICVFSSLFRLGLLWLFCLRLLCLCLVHIFYGLFALPMPCLFLVYVFSVLSAMPVPHSHFLWLICYTYALFVSLWLVCYTYALFASSVACLQRPLCLPLRLRLPWLALSVSAMPAPRTRLLWLVCVVRSVCVYV